MTRVVSLFLPTLSTDRVRRKSGDAAPPPEAPLVLVGREGRRRVVLAANAAAQTAGLCVGMPATEAQVLVPGLIIQDSDPAADAEALDRLAIWMLQRFAPIVAPGVAIVADPGMPTGAAHRVAFDAERMAPRMGSRSCRRSAKRSPSGINAWATRSAPLQRRPSEASGCPCAVRTRLSLTGCER
jgi:impB/mucB/samB family